MLTKKLYFLFIGCVITLNQKMYADVGSVRILYEEKIYPSSRGHPLMQATLKGVKTKVILDTAGSGAPFLTEQFVRKAKIISKATNITSPIFLKKKIGVNLGSLNIHYDMLGLSKTKDQWYEQQNIAGVFNPLTVIRAIAKQHPINHVVLDFLTGHFYGVDAPTQKEIDDYLDTRYSQQIKMVTSIKANNYYRLVVLASIKGKKEVPVLIDTGANASSFDKAYLANIPVVSQHHVRNFTGQDFIKYQVASQSVLLNSQLIGKLELGIYDPSTKIKGPFRPDKAYRGIIGMNLLKRCALVISRAQIATFYCNPP